MYDRLVKPFMEMVRIDSESGDEARRMAYLIDAKPGFITGFTDASIYNNRTSRLPWWALAPRTSTPPRSASPWQTWKKRSPRWWRCRA